MGRDTSEVRGQDKVYCHSLELVTLLHCKLLVTKTFNSYVDRDCSYGSSVAIFPLNSFFWT